MFCPRKFAGRRNRAGSPLSFDPMVSDPTPEIVGDVIITFSATWPGWPRPAQ
jgi:hypothetical protein